MKKNYNNIAAVYGLNVHNLDASEVEEAMDWRELSRVEKKRPKGWKKSWNRHGLEKLVEEAREYYEYKTGKGLPYNLATWGPWVGSSRDYKNLYEGDRFDSPAAEDMVEVAARFSSWLRIIADKKLVGLQCVLEKNLDYGMNAKGTNINPYDFLDVWNSPRTAENMFWKSYRRARQILEPFGLVPSWEAVGKIMISSKVSYRVGKMAFAIAAKTVNLYLGGYWEDLLTGSSVEILTKARGVAFLKKYSSRSERLDYARWAVLRVEAGEFTSLREAFEVIENRLVDWGDGTIVDCCRIMKHGDMLEVPLAFDSQSYFYFKGGVLLENNPSKAWQMLAAAEIVRRRYGANVKIKNWELCPTIFKEGYGHLPAMSNQQGIRLAVKNWLCRTLLGGQNRPTKVFKGWRVGVASSQVESWAFDRILAGEFKNFEEAILASNRLTDDSTDGVELLIDPEFIEVIHRVECIPGWEKGGQKQFVLKQNNTERTYHVSRNNFTVRGAVKEAIIAWRRQAAVERKRSDVLKVLRPKNASVLVWFKDSLDAGNCSPGTRLWAQSHGFNGDMFAPAEKLLRFSEDSRVFRVLQVAAEKVAELKLN